MDCLIDEKLDGRDLCVDDMMEFSERFAQSHLFFRCWFHGYFLWVGLGNFGFAGA